MCLCTSVTNGGMTNFLIDYKSGRIELAKRLDYEHFTTYDLKIVCTDGGGLKVGALFVLFGKPGKLLHR